jgi:spermidine/putrescine transport system ATP-binding protein
VVPNYPEASGVPAVELSDVSKAFGEVIAVEELSLAIRDGEFFSLLGPSGCGKTTTLRMIAGFEAPSLGDIFIRGQSMVGIPAHRRPVNTVFQSYALFPHMTVHKNIAFGLEMKKVPNEEINRRVSETLELVQLKGMGERKPRQLSGGQQQRVALARALVNRPDVLLLDEPLGALDLKLRKAMQLELKQIQTEVGITFIYVTHDQEEALTMSDRIAVMDLGLVQQIGPPKDIYEHPANRFVADFIGETNFLTGNVTQIETFVQVEVDSVPLLGVSNGHEVIPGQSVTLAIRPEKINLYPHGEIAATNAELDPGELAELFGSELPSGTINLKRYLAAEGANVVLNGSIVEAIYIGTDMRYQVAITDNVTISVRMQNFGSRYDESYVAGDKVYVHWAIENAQVLTE